MKARVVLLPDGNIRLFIDEGSVEEAAAALRRLLAGIDLEVVGEIERHRHEDEAAHADLHVHVH